jgi:hypothetical protein
LITVKFNKSVLSFKLFSLKIISKISMGGIMKSKYLMLTIVCLVLSNAVNAQQQERFFQQNAPWFQDISQAASDAQSSEIITWLQSKGGWGGGRFQIDFSIEVLTADNTTAFKTFSPTADFYTPDCDKVPVPVPSTGHLEGETGYRCVNDGDCHLLVFYTPTRTLYEMWRANIVNQTFNGGCLAVWELNTPWNTNGRGNDCTSADAAGLEISPLLFTADEVTSGKINHAIRFILPNERIRHLTYVHPGTHATSAASGGNAAPPYGARFRLRPDFPLSTLSSQGARVVAVALQKYGMFLADGGTVALTAQSDSYTKAKWSGLLGPLDLNAIKVTDFQMVDGKERYTWTGDCVRTPMAVQQQKQFQKSGISKMIINNYGKMIIDGNPDGISKISIADIQGRIRMELPGSAFATSRIELPVGIYFYKLYKQNAVVCGKVTVLQHCMER